MTENNIISRRYALKELQKFGITGEQVYLIDVIPLIEIMWADGHTQPSEMSILEAYLEKHVDCVNKQAGCRVLELDQAKKFVNRFLAHRPSPEIMETLRGFVKPLRLSSADKKENQVLRDSILATCMDIASIAVVEYPYHFEERFCLDEKKCFFSICESLAEEDEVPSHALQ
jgi:hypothetical protein